MQDEQQDAERDTAHRHVRQARKHRVDRQDLAWKIHLANQVDVLDQALGALVQAVGEELPRDDAGHQEHWIRNVGQVGSTQHLLNQEREHSGQQQRLDQNPQVAQVGLFRARLQVAQNEHVQDLAPPGEITSPGGGSGCLARSVGASA
jgi:hypothetical protein